MSDNIEIIIVRSIVLFVFDLLRSSINFVIEVKIYFCMFLRHVGSPNATVKFASINSQT